MKPAQPPPPDVRRRPLSPAGTGKTSLIAAICNYMQFSCYDLDLSGVQSNGELRALLAQTSNRHAASWAG